VKSQGVFERRNHLVEISGQFHVTSDNRPERDWRRTDGAGRELDVVEIVMKVWATTAIRAFPTNSCTASSNSAR